MKITVDSKSFVDAVAWVTKSYDQKNDRAYVALSVNDEGKGILAHSNDNSYMKSEFNVISADFNDDDVNEATFAVDGSYLKNLATAIGNADGEVVISKKLKTERTSLDVKTSLGKFTVPMLDNKVSADPEIVEIGEVDDNEFFDSLTRIAKLCDSDNSGASNFLGSVEFGFSEDSIKMFATDRFAMGEIKLDFSRSDDEDDFIETLLEKNILLPAASASLIPATKGVNTSITLIAEDGGDGTQRFGYLFPNGRVALFSLTNSPAFTHFEKMKQKTIKDIDYEIVVPTSALKSAIKTISSLAPSEESVYLTINKKGIVVTDSSKSNSLKVESSGLVYDSDEDYRARFLRLIINESFSPISTSVVKLKWGSASKAFVFEPITEDGKSVENVFVMAVVGN